jgi:hypothetical protein
LNDQIEKRTQRVFSPLIAMLDVVFHDTIAAAAATTLNLYAVMPFSFQFFLPHKQ